MVFPTVRRNPDFGVYIFLFIAFILLVIFFAVSLLVFLKARDLKRNSSLQTCAGVVSFFFELSRKFFFMPVLGILLMGFDCDAIDLENCYGGKKLERESGIRIRWDDRVSEQEYLPLRGECK